MNSVKSFFLQYRHIAFYGVCLAILIFTLKWMEWKFLILNHSLDIYIGLIALFFTSLGVWVATQLVKPKIQTHYVEKPVYISQPAEFVLNEVELEKLELSSREYEVLQLLAKGLSNAEIAESLFLSLSTVKTHVSNLFSKLEVKNRVQAIEKGKRLEIITF